VTLIILATIAAVILAAIFVAVTLRRVVPTNMVDIVQSRKTTTSYGSGAGSNVYYQWPAFLPLLGVVVTRLPVSVFKVSLKDYASYDSGRLPFLVDVAAFFRVEDSNIAAQRVSSFEQLQQQLISILEGAVRVTLAQHKLEEIMQDRAVLGATFTKNVQSALAEWGVATVQDIQFMDLRDVADSKVIHNIMAKESSRIEKESRTMVADNHRAAAEAEIEAQRQVDLQAQDATEQVGIRTAAQTQNVGIAKQKSDQQVLTEAQETKTREMAVRQVEAVRTAEIARDVATVTAEQQRKVTVIDADAEKQRLTTVADGSLAAAQRDAEAITVKGEAEGRAKTAVLLAEVTPQITLAKEIGSNEGYQHYLISIKNVEANRDVGIEQAKALTAADVRVIATGGDVSGSVSSIGDIFSAKGGARLAATLAGLAQTDEGAAVVERVTAGKSAKPNGGGHVAA
jgi:flotillin